MLNNKIEFILCLLLFIFITCLTACSPHLAVGRELPARSTKAYCHI